MMHNAHLYEKSNANLITAVLGSKQPVPENNPTGFTGQVKRN
jgi:hypothetical protein